MPSLARSAHPVKTLREETTVLEAAVLLCLAKPRKKAVHQLRTATRRIEAQLELLSMLPGLPAPDKTREKTLGMLGKLRRAAGEVRDLDVQRDLIRDEVSPADKRSRQDPQLRKEADKLRSQLKRQRDTEAARLEKLLKKEKTKLPLLFGELFDTLGPAGDLTLPEPQLTALVKNWYAHPPDLAPHSEVDLGDAEQLHTIRKRAKLARYLAESAPKTATRARKLAARFENIQEAGGQWHDWLLLAELASKKLGRKAQLSQRFATNAARSLTSYKRRLAAGI